MIHLKCPAKYDVQSNIGTIKVPSEVPTNWVWLQIAEASTHFANASRLPMSVFRYFCFNNPKLQSGKNFVCPTTRKERVILVCLPVITRHDRYCIMVLFLFCPQQLSACKTTSFLQTRDSQKSDVYNWLTTTFAPLPQSTASSFK